MKNQVIVEGATARILFGTRFGLTGYETVIDLVDLEGLASEVGNASIGMRKSPVSTMQYAGWSEIGTRKTRYVHRFLLGYPDLEVDHRNRNGLDNRRENLREATHSQNAFNRVHTCAKIVRAKHYYFRERDKIFVGQVSIAGKQYNKCSVSEDVIKAWVAEMREKQAAWRKSITTC